MTMLALLSAALAAASLPATSRREVFVDPLVGDDASLLGTQVSPVRSVHAAAAVVRSLLREQPERHVTVQLLPGLHHVGDRPLALGPSDGGRGAGWVTWRSLNPELPATVGAPIPVLGWKAHPTVKGALIAPLPANVTKGSALRQFWVAGKRAQRTRVYGHGRQTGDNRKGRHPLPAHTHASRWLLARSAGALVRLSDSGGMACSQASVTI